ncbi:uncharacterized protein LODBEIA_P20280 [Lodderomyces beijingensis]|uniref:BPL/LPL catalytic domain-containing protein n=1 Tax=Lodderomyces beijingensis TaxID=1775926 RepID=A0ABP0ZIV8_9ASCO
MNVLVYSGPGTTVEGVKQCLESLRLHLSAYYAVIAVSETVLLTEPWMRKTSVLVIPGGADLPFCKILNGEGNKRITSYVKNGGKFMGFCAGGYYASARCEFEVGTPLEVSGPRELKFYPGTSRGCAFKGFQYESQVGARAVKLLVNTSLLPGAPSTVFNYYNGGGLFAEASKYKGVQVLASYDGTTDIEDADKAAVVYAKVGKGDVILTGTHPEYSPSLFKEVEEKFEPVVQTLQETNHNRKLFLKQLLKKLGLRVREDVDSTVPSITPVFIASPSGEKIRELEDSLQRNLDVERGVFQDSNDVFVFQNLHEGELKSDHKTPTYLNFTEEIPSGKVTPYFNMGKYFDSLKSLVGAEGCCRFGGILGYAEVIGSTNTLLDRNPAFLKQLPNGFTLTASTQIAGRGRGGNVWINPRGVLATSILFRVPQSKDASSLIVTLQYLCGLALIESILGYGSSSTSCGKGVGYENLPVRLKWPNDIFVLKPEYIDSLEHKVGSTVDGDDEKYVKISGALVNSQYMDGSYHLVWGGGVNVSNPAPTTSLNLVLEKLNNVRKAKNLSALPPYEPELLLARLMSTVDSFYKVFEKSGLKPFLPLYYKRWFHSDQTVDVDGAGGNRKTCQIKGITPDFGLLIAEDIATGERLHLQPDGNSFDIFKGLVYKKNT